MSTAPQLRPVRVAIYTRKSVTDGLDQAFNSLDAQRSAIEAYVSSQASLGWQATGKRYDDGGYSGSTTDRPAFQSLLADVQAGLIDVVAVYKIDRLSRSLRDFAKLIDLFEKSKVTFVSVTQQFSTANSIGRLTLNVLMSFAEFEREVIGERIRDKIAATRRRGAWTGGRPILGYDVVAKKLVVNQDEATQVRATFQLYLERGSLRETVDELRRRGWRNKTIASKANEHLFSKATLHALLTNSLYTGQMRCGQDLVAGQHDRIVDAETWDAVQAQLRSHAPAGGGSARNKTGALLRGLLRCGRCGSAMVHTFSTRKERRSRYYVCARLHNEGAETCPGSRVPAGRFEQFIADQIRVIGTDPGLQARTAEAIANAATGRGDELDSELRRAEQDRRQLEKQRADLLRAVPPSAEAARPLLAEVAGIEERLRAIKVRSDEVRLERQAVADGVSATDLGDAMAGFAPIWEHLFPRERERILRLLIEQITYDPETGDADIQLRACGITTLAEEARTTA